MIEGWEEKTLGDIASVKGGKRLPKGSALTEFTTSHPYIRTTDISVGRINERELLFVPDDVFPAISKYTVESSDVIISIVGTIGVVAKIPASLHLASLTENCAKIVDVKDEILHRGFLFYFLSSDEGQTEIQRRNVGSTQPKLPLYNIKTIPVPLPPLREQKAIAEILSSLDDKIDLLHRQNATLEALAETLFRQYFIEEAQDDWEECSLIDAIQLIGGGTPKTKVEAYWNGNIPWLSCGDITAKHRSFVGNSEKFISLEGLVNSSTKLLPANATVVTARGTVGKFALLARPMAFSQSNYGVLPAAQFENCFYFTYLLVNHSIAELQSTAYGSVFDTITVRSFEAILLRLPKPEQVAQFDGEVAPYIEKMHTNSKQIVSLEELRDRLLPKLMSGQVRLEGFGNV